MDGAKGYVCVKQEQLVRNIVLVFIFGSFYATVLSLIKYDLIYPPTSPYNPNNSQVETKWK